MDTPIQRGEYNEFKTRVSDKEKRTDKRLEILENTVREINVIATSVEKLAINIEYMVQEQKEQREELREQWTEIDTLKERDGDMWRSSIKYVLTLAIGGVLGLAAKALVAGGIL